MYTHQCAHQCTHQYTGYQLSIYFINVLSVSAHQDTGQQAEVSSHGTSMRLTVPDQRLHGGLVAMVFWVLVHLTVSWGHCIRKPQSDLHGLQVTKDTLTFSMLTHNPKPSWTFLLRVSVTAQLLGDKAPQYTAYSRGCNCKQIMSYLPPTHLLFCCLWLVQ